MNFISQLRFIRSKLVEEIKASAQSADDTEYLRAAQEIADLREQIELIDRVIDEEVKTSKD